MDRSREGSQPLAFDHKHVPAPARWMVDLSEPLKQRIVSDSQTKFFARGSKIYAEGDEPGGIYGIVDGVVAAHGGEATLLIGHLLGPGTWFGESAALTRLPRGMSATAMTETCVTYLAADAIEEIGSEYPELWRGLASLAATNTYILLQVASDLMITRPEARVIAVLRRLGDSLGIDMPIPLSQEQLADMCVLSRGAVSRILSRLESAGKVRRGYREIWWLGDRHRSW
ncbi:unnamed protein product [Ectocarpus sp. 12 AP-2014]